MDILATAYAMAEANDGIPGIDGVTFADIKELGVDTFLTQIQHELVTRTYEPLKNRRYGLRKDGGGIRMLSIPTVRDRVVQGALRLVLEPIFEADFQQGSFGYRPKRSAHAAINRAATAIVEGKTRVIHIDLQTFFDRIRHHRVLQLIATRVQDDHVMHLLKRMLVVNGKVGAPQGGVISPLLSNIYLNGVDRMLEQLQAETRFGEYTAIQYVRYADDLVVLVDGHPRHEWLTQVINDRVRQELTKLEVQVNEEKTRLVDVVRGDRFEFLGFEFSRVRSHKGAWRPHYTPTVKKQAEVRQNLATKFMDVVKWGQAPTAEQIKEHINPIIRGWVDYFSIGHSDHCFCQIRAFLERLVLQRMFDPEGHRPTRHEQREWIYGTLGLFNKYQTRHYVPKPSPLCPWG
jgi:RNA-directed DNA polymerase